MADFALWAAACEQALWPAGTFGCAYEATAGPRSSAPSMPTRSRLACGRSWPSADCGLGAPSTSCISAWVATVTARHVTVPAGPKIRAPSLAGCVARRPSCGSWASRLHSVVKAEQETGLLRYGGRLKIPSAPSAPSAASGTMRRRLKALAVLLQSQIKTSQLLSRSKQAQFKLYVCSPRQVLTVAPGGIRVASRRRSGTAGPGRRAPS
jgi:hypothetical protein